MKETAQYISHKVCIYNLTIFKFILFLDSNSVSPILYHRKLVERIDTNADGQLDRDELFTWLSKVEDKAFMDEATNVFYKEDTDRDGYVTVEEYLANSGLPGKT